MSKGVTLKLWHFCVLGILGLLGILGWYIPEYFASRTESRAQAVITSITGKLGVSNPKADLRSIELLDEVYIITWINDNALHRGLVLGDMIIDLGIIPPPSTPSD